MARRKAAEEEAQPEIRPRPVTGEGLFGHARAKALLARALTRGALNPSLIFAGPSGLGKASLAYRLAAALQCEAPAPWACGECGPCRKVIRGTHPDIREITIGVDEKTGRPKKEIVVGQMRESVLAPLALPPYEGKKLVFLVDPAEALNTESQNALLKSLEEPPSYAQFLLITANPAGLLPTVRSRCQVVTFGPVSAPEMAVAAAAAGLSGTEAQEALAAVAGAPGPLLSGAWRESARRRKALAALLQGGLVAENYSDLAPLLEGLAGEPPRLVLADALRLVSDARRAVVSGRGPLLAAGRARGADGLERVADRLAESVGHLERNVNPRLLLDRAFLVP